MSLNLRLETSESRAVRAVRPREDEIRYQEVYRLIAVLLPLILPRERSEEFISFGFVSFAVSFTCNRREHATAYPSTHFRNSVPRSDRRR